MWSWKTKDNFASISFIGSSLFCFRPNNFKKGKGCTSLCRGVGVYISRRWIRPQKPWYTQHLQPKKMDQTLYRSGKYGEYRNIDYLIYVAVGHTGIQLTKVLWCFYDAATYELQNMCSIGLRGLMLWQQLTLTLFLVLEMQVKIF